MRELAPELLQTARTQRWRPEELLELLVREEIEAREASNLRRRMKAACFPGQKTLAGFNPEASELPRATFSFLSSLEWLARRENLCLAGPAGTGKSHLAQALGQEACRRGYDVVFTPAAKMLAHLHGGRADGTYDRRLSGYLRPDLLILDDFGLRPLRDREGEDFYEVIGERYERGSILVTSNRDYSEWPEAFGENPLLASAALDRLAHRAHLITITGASYRAQDRARLLGKVA